MKTSAFFSALFAGIVLYAAPAAVKVTDYNPGREDATAALQSALDSGAAQVIIDDPGFPYTVKQIHLRSNQEVIIKNGVTILAKAGEFHHRTQSLFRAEKVSNLILRGEGRAVLEMRKKDYQNPKLYVHSEWRHTLSLLNSRNVTVRDLTLKSSGGDGIYVGGSAKPFGCSDILIENVVCDDNHRQGISVISARNLTVRNSKFVKTSGTPPACGIDFEPNKAQNYLENILVENCDFSGNASNGILFHLRPLKHKVSRPVSVIIRNCTINNNNGSAFGFTIGDVSGSIKVENCTANGNRGRAVIFQRIHGHCSITLENCAMTHRENTAPVMIIAADPVNAGNIHFKKVKMYTAANPVMFDGLNGFGVVNSSFDIAYGKNDKAMKKFNSAAFIKQNRPDPALQKRLVTLPVEPKKFSAATAPVNSSFGANFRGRFRYIVAVPAAGTYPIEFHLRQLGKNAPQLDVTVNDSNGTPHDKVTFKSAGKLVYNLKAKSAATFILTIDPYHHVLNLVSPLSGGLIADNKIPLIWNSHPRWYFVVPAAAKEVNLEILGSAGETVSARVYNSANKCVAKVDRISSARVLNIKRTPSAKDEFWVFHITYAREDHGVRLGAPCLPIFYAVPQNILNAVK